MGQMPVDLQRSTQWAMANVSSKGALGLTATTFDLVNIHTQRAHRLVMKSGGIDAGPFPFTFSPSSSMSDYGYFTTYRPVNFHDFDGVGARLISGNAMAWSWSSLTLWDGPAYVSHGLAWVRMSGWGVAVPGAGVDHGWATILYGDGKPLGNPESMIDIEVPPTPEEIYTQITITVQDDSLVVALSGDVLFDFDEFDVKKEADQPLTQAAAVIRSASRAGSVILINGHTDSVGTDSYNLVLSQKRADAVAQWFVSRNYFPIGSIKTEGKGSQFAVASNADDAGRAKNRRVEIFVRNR